MAAKILWRDAQGQEGTLPLTAGEVRIGRAMDCELRCDDGMVSRYHAKIQLTQSGYLLTDLGSANGCFFQEARVSTHLFVNGQAVRCGNLWLRFVDDGRPQVSVPPRAVSQQPRAVSHGPPPAAPPLSVDVPPVSVSAPNPAPSLPRPQSAPSDNGSFEEIKRLRRRVEQLETELRIIRGSGGKAEVAQKLEDLERDHAALTEERDQLRDKLGNLQNVVKDEGLDARMSRANQVLGDAEEVVSELNDVLSNLRINVMAAEGEFSQFPKELPIASFELIQDSLRSCSEDAETARKLLRKIRNL